MLSNFPLAEHNNCGFELDEMYSLRSVIAVHEFSTINQRYGRLLLNNIR